MEIIKKIFKFIFSEAHKGNFLPLAGVVALTYYILMPLYIKTIDSISTNTQANSEIAIDMYELRKELAELKEGIDKEFRDRKPGVMGYTSK